MSRQRTPYTFWIKRGNTTPQQVPTNRIDWDTFEITMSRDNPWDLYAVTISFDYHLRAHESVPDDFALGSRIALRTSTIHSLGTAFVGRMEAPGVEPRPGGRAVVRVRAIDWVARAQRTPLPKDMTTYGGVGQPGWHLFRHCQWLSDVITDDPMNDFTGTDGLPSEVFPYDVGNYPGGNLPSGVCSVGLTSHGEGLTVYEMLRRIANSSGSPYMRRDIFPTPAVTFQDLATWEIPVAQFNGDRIELAGEWRQSSDGIVNVARVGRMQGKVTSGGQTVRESSQVDPIKVGPSYLRNEVGEIVHEVDTIWNQISDGSPAIALREACAQPFLATSRTRTWWAPKELTVHRVGWTSLANMITGGPVNLSLIANHAIPYRYIELAPLSVRITMDPIATSFQDSMQITMSGIVTNAAVRTEKFWGEMWGTWAQTTGNWSTQ